MSGISFSPTAVEIIVRNNARLKRLRVALHKEEGKKDSSEDRIKELCVEIDKREKMANDVEGALA